MAAGVCPPGRIPQVNNVSPTGGLAIRAILVYISIMKNQKVITIVLCLLLLGIYTAEAAKKKKMVLFPEREYIKKHSVPFFKKVNLTFPPISRVDFYVKSGTYRSAYINLTETVTKNEYLKTILPRFGENNRSLIDTFNEKYKKDLEIESYPQVLEALKISKVKFHLLLIHTLINDYNGSSLSGKNAFKLWNIFLKITEKTYKKKGNTAEKGAVLGLSSHFVFFKKAKKWEKKARKIIKKIPPDSIDDPDVLLILKGKG